jgi:hypothetical protein
MLMVILTIIGIIFTWSFYRWACRMATRSVASTEQTGELMQALIDAMPPEAQARAAEAAAREPRKRQSQRHNSGCEGSSGRPSSPSSSF